MPKNRSVMSDVILPHIVYQDLPNAIAWLTRVFGFIEHYRYGNPPSGAQLLLGNACIMVNQAKPGQSSPAQVGYGTQSLTVFVDDVEGQFERARAAGAKVLETPHETVYGEFQCAFEDLDGHRWLFSRHTKDIDPADWGATLASSKHD
jgi:uncharacterized glyoxalase superfamily protein PhnB